MLPRSARYMLQSAFAFSVMTLLVKLVGRRLPSQELVTARAVVTFVLSYVALRRANVPLLGSRRPLLWLRGLCGFFGLSCVYYAVTHMPLAEATVLQYLHPAFTALLAAIVLREQVQRATVISIALSMTGLLVIARPVSLLHSGLGALDSTAILAAVGGALFSACAYVIVRKLGEREHPLVIVFYFPLVALPVSIPAMWTHAVWPVGWEWLLLLLVGITTQIGQVAVTRGLQLDAAGRAASYSYMQVLFAAGWGILFFGEIPAAATVMGACLIFVGALISVRASRQAQAAVSEPPLA
jgi:drug/metabolite transporter (DMT)-like permease